MECVGGLGVGDSTGGGVKGGVVEDASGAISRRRCHSRKRAGPKGGGCVDDTASSMDHSRRRSVERVMYPDIVR